MKQFFLLLCVAGALAFGVDYFAPFLKQSRIQQQPLAVAALPATIVRGEKTFGQYCQHCHDVSVPRTLEQGGLLPYGLTETDLESVLANGPGNMPEFDGMFTQREVQDLHAFLRHALRPNAPI